MVGKGGRRNRDRADRDANERTTAKTEGTERDPYGRTKFDRIDEVAERDNKEDIQTRKNTTGTDKKNKMQSEKRQSSKSKDEISAKGSSNTSPRSNAKTTKRTDQIRFGEKFRDEKFNEMGSTKNEEIQSDNKRHMGTVKKYFGANNEADGGFGMRMKKGGKKSDKTTEKGQIAPPSEERDNQFRKTVSMESTPKESFGSGLHVSSKISEAFGQSSAGVSKPIEQVNSDKNLHNNWSSTTEHSGIEKRDTEV